MAIIICAACKTEVESCAVDDCYAEFDEGDSIICKKDIDGEFYHEHKKCPETDVETQAIVGEPNEPGEAEPPFMTPGQIWYAALVFAVFIAYVLYTNRAVLYTLLQ